MQVSLPLKAFSVGCALLAGHDVGPSQLEEAAGVCLRQGVAGIALLEPLAVAGIPRAEEALRRAVRQQERTLVRSGRAFGPETTRALAEGAAYESHYVSALAGRVTAGEPGHAISITMTRLAACEARLADL